MSAPMLPPEQCPQPECHGNPWRYCPACSWTEEPARKPSPILRYFASGHLPEPLREVSAPIAELAAALDSSLPDGPEKSTGLRKLLEAKDAFVRAALP